MNIYAILLLIAAVGLFAYATGMKEPFDFLEIQFDKVLSDIKRNNIIYNSVVLIIVIALFAAIIRKLFKKKDDSDSEPNLASMTPDQLLQHRISQAMESRTNQR